MSLNDIPIVNDFTSLVSEPEHSARALLHEIETLLQQLLDSGEGGVIDLNTIPLSPDNYQYLEMTLGTGEVAATLNTLGKSTITESRFTGVWWIKHFDENNQMVAELIEVATIPTILHSDPRDIGDGLKLLRQQLQSDGGEHVQ